MSETGLDRSFLSTLRDRKTFDKIRSPITSLDFSRDGEHLITTSENNFITVYDVLKASVVKTVSSFPTHN